MIYSGIFRNINDEVIQVEIITSSGEGEVELMFSGESPVTITQSSDGLYSPIKSRSCTITIVAEGPYLDMYSASSHGTKVIVRNQTTNKCLFFGYLTPCEYNQPYLILNEIELEAVDALSSLQDFRYTYQNGESAELVSVSSILQNLLKDVAGYPGGIYMQKLAMQMKKGHDDGFYPTQFEFIAEDMFFGDDEDDTKTCYEVLEEICKYFCISACPLGEDVYFVDYEAVAKYDVNHSWLPASNTLQYVNIIDKTVVEQSVPGYINETSYAGAEHDMELDKVYNKIKAEAETLEVDDDELVYDPMNVAGRSTYYKTEEWGVLGKDNKTYRSYTRLFEFKNNKAENAWGRWSTHNNTNTIYGGSGLGWVVSPAFINQHESISESRAEFPWPSGGQLNQIAGQTCLPSQIFVYEATKSIPAKIDWDDTLVFIPQMQWLREFYTNRWTISENWGDMYHYWWDFYEKSSLRYPVLTYESKRDIQFSPASEDYTNYLGFKGDILLQQNCTLDGFTYNVWMHESGTHNYSGWLFPIKEAGAKGYQIYHREPGQTDYNKGWPQIKMKLQIGDKYWNGSRWVKTECTFWINYHKENVSTENEQIIYGDWMKPVTNHTYLSNINEECFAIPITYSDGLHGRLKFDIYMPFIHYTTGMFVTYNYPSQGQNWYWKGTDIIAGEVAPAPIDYFDYKLTPPAIFMKDLSLELISAPNGSPWYNFKDLEDDDDITYTNEIDSNNVIENDDLSFEINTYNKKVPISQSYILEPFEFQRDVRYFCASEDFASNPNPKQFKDAYLNPKFAYEIYINEFDTEYFDYYASWYNTEYPMFIWEGGYPAYVRVGDGEVHSCELQRYQDASTSQYVTVLRVGEFHDSQADAITDSIGTAFYAAAAHAGQIEFITERLDESMFVPPPDDIYPPSMKHETGTIDITKVNKVTPHSEGFYRPHTNEVKVEELNIIDRYVEHHTNPKKIYNCTIHGYFEPWRCLTVKALNDTKMIVSEQDYDVIHDSNEVKLIEL